VSTQQFSTTLTDVICLHVPALLAAKANRTPAGTLYTGIRLTGEGQRRVLLVGDCLIHA
jgi:hypothetical protein